MKVVKLLLIFIVIVQTNCFGNWKDVSIHSKNVCGIDGSKIRCWGEGELESKNFPQGLNDLIGVATGKNHSCAISKFRTFCWGDRGVLDTSSLSLGGPLKKVIVSSRQTCVLSKGRFGRFKCIGHETDKTDWAQAEDIAAGEDFVCALKSGRIKCWGDRTKPGHFRTAGARTISIGGNELCMLGDEGVKCFNHKSNWHTDNYIDVNGLKNPQSISVGKYYACAIDDEGVKCWSHAKNDYRAELVGTFYNPKKVSIHSGKYCVIDDFNIQCNDFYKNKEISITPSYPDNPISISSGYNHMCILEKKDVKCLGKNNDYDQLDVPKNLKNPREISSFGNVNCVLDDEGIKCWGDIDTSFIPENLKGARNLIVSSDHSCIRGTFNGAVCWLHKRRSNEEAMKVSLSDRNKNRFIIPNEVRRGGFLNLIRYDKHICGVRTSEVVCWKDREHFVFEKNKLDSRTFWKKKGKVSQKCHISEKELTCFKADIPYSRNPQTFYTFGYDNYRSVLCINDHYNFSCDEHIKKRGPVSSLYKDFPKGLKNVRAVSGTTGHICVLHDEGVRCWGELDYNIKYEKYETFLKKIMNNSSPLKATFIKDLMPDLIFYSKLVHSKYLSFKLLTPVIESSDSKIFLEEIKPHYEDIKNHFNQMSTYDEYKDHYDIKVLVKFMLSALKTSELVLSNEDKHKILLLKKVLHKTYFSVDLDSVGVLLEEYSSVKPILEKLSESPKTSFLFDTIDLGFSFLKKEKNE